MNDQVLIQKQNDLGTCRRGNVSCSNENGESQKCCNYKDCNLDRVKSLSWDKDLGFNDKCYQNCAENKCYPNGKYIAIIFLHCNV